MPLFAILIIIWSSTISFSEDQISIVARSSKLENFPCSQCHKPENIKEVITLPLIKQHQDFQTKHMENDTNCYFCHHKKDFDKFQLLTGEIIEFDDSYRVCSQCHGDKKNDWNDAIHGKQTGNWNGQKKRLNCMACHNPHVPAVKKIMPDPAPELPRQGSKREVHHE